VPTKPFVADKTIRVVNVARQHWQDRHSVYIGRTMQRKPRAAPSFWLQLEHDPRGENKMEAIVLTDDELKVLETRFGPVVRQMGPWNSDGIFGYQSVPIVAVEKAAETIENTNLPTALPRLRTPEGTKVFVELLDSFGPTLVERIVDAYREFSFRPNLMVLMSSRNAWPVS
jgi:hypothetical protein